MERTIDSTLIAWKNNPDRMVLLVRGARQTGKTFSIRTLGKQFPHYLEVNFEEHPEVKPFFDGPLTPQYLCERLSGYFTAPVIPGKTLLFFDEVQQCPNCMKSLRFFHEKMPELHVVAAGSLLEFTIEELPSFGVGRIVSFFMYPLSFVEFVKATEGASLAQVMAGADPSHPIEAPFHRRFLELFRTYQVIGGMPAVVDAYSARRDLSECQKILDALLATFRDDFGKYRKRVPAVRMAETFKAAALQAGSKFMYAAVSPDASHHEAKRSLELLEQAGLVFKAVHSDARGIPLGASVNQRRFKTLVFDTGIHQRLTGLVLAEHLVSDYGSLINRGGAAELFTGLNLLSGGSPLIRPELFYWHREARSSNAEVDYVIVKNGIVIPLEVKSGFKGGMKSMRLFMEERKSPVGIRLSQENFGSYGNILTFPVYAAGLLANEDFRLPV
jgi:uncharacterized protein